MSFVHTPTLMLMTGVASLIVSTAIAVQPTTRPLLTARYTWALGFLFSGLGWFAVALRGPMPWWLSVYIGNGMIAAGFAALIVGFERFRGRPARWWLIPVAFLAVVAVFGVLALVGENTIRARTIAANAVGLALAGEAIRVVAPLRRDVHKPQATAFIVLVVLVVLTLLARMSDAALGGEIGSMMTVGGFHAAAFFSYTITTIGMGIAMLGLMHLSLREKWRQEVEIRDQILSLIGHDLRTPFNTLLSGADVIRFALQRNELERAQDFAERMQSAAHRAYTLLENLLAWGHAHASGGHNERERHTVAALIADALSPNQETLEEKNITPVVAHGDLTITADASAVAAVLRNLISNAARHAPENGEIHIEARPVSGEVEVAVRDDGPGLPADLRDILTCPTPPEDVPERIRQNVTGLGLYLAAKIAQSAGGRLLAREPEAGGTLLAARFPAQGVQG